MVAYGRLSFRSIYDITTTAKHSARNRGEREGREELKDTVFEISFVFKELCSLVEERKHQTLIREGVWNKAFRRSTMSFLGELS